MIRLGLAVMATVVIVVFAISNSHHVDLRIAIGEPVQIRLIFLLLSAFIAGMVVPVFYRLYRRLDLDKQLRRESELQQAIDRVEHDIVA